MVYLKNPTKKDLVFPLNNVELPAGKAVKVEDSTAQHILKTWKFMELVGKPKGKEKKESGSKAKTEEKVKPKSKAKKSKKSKK